MTDPEMQARIEKDKLETRAYARSFPRRDPEEVNAENAEYNSRVSNREDLGRPIGQTALKAALPRKHNYEYDEVNLDSYDGPAAKDSVEEDTAKPNNSSDDIKQDI